MSFIQRYGRCIYAKVTPEPNENSQEENQEEGQGEIQLSTDEYVDLGLPSGTLWYNSNLGANSPTARGAYFSWGNKEGYVASYTEGDYEGTIVGYSFIQSNYELTNGYQLSDGYIPVENDAANDTLGEGWVIPTATQFQELLDNCTLTWVTIDEVPGKLFTSNINGNVIFLPNTGCGNADTLSSPRFEAGYWTSTEDENNTNNAYAFALSTTILPNLTPVHPEEKRFGYGIRPVKVPL